MAIVIFFGTADLAVPSLALLAQSNRLKVALVVTQPDRPKGRGLQLQPSPVKAEAQRRNLPVAQPDRIRDPSFMESLREIGPDLMVVAAYGKILPQALLDIPRLGCLNVHASLLPKYRGAAPIQWALLNGETETGVTIMKMDAGLDTGDILSQEAIPILPRDNAQSLHDRLAQLGAHLLVQTIDRLLSGQLLPRPQPAEGAGYAPKITEAHEHIDWTKPASNLANQVRALSPRPGAFTHLPGESRIRLKILDAEAVPGTGSPGEILEAQGDRLLVAAGEGALRILRLQQAGRQAMETRAFLSGHPLNRGDRLG